MDELPLRAVVIGSGVGGAAAALLLSHAGIPTLLAEKERRLGGAAAAYERDGFRVDTGTHMLCRGEEGPLGDVLRRVGHGDAITFRQSSEPPALCVAGGARAARAGAAPRAGRVVLQAELWRLAGAARELARGLDLTALEAARAARLLAHAAAMRDVDMAACDDATAEAYAARFVPRAAAAARLGGLLGLPLLLPGAEASAGEALFSWRRIARSGQQRYPEGGAARVPEVFCRLARELGAAVWTGAGVRRVLVSDRRVRGVELEDGTALPARIVVSTVGLLPTVSGLVGEAHFPEAYVARARALAPQPRQVQVKIGLRRRLAAAGALAGLGGGSDGDGAPALPFYCLVPTRFDPSLAPPGHELLCACAVSGGRGGASRGAPAASVDGLLRALAGAVPGLLSEAIFVDGAPADGRGEALAQAGELAGELATATAQTPGQVGRARPAVYTPVRGLYLAGRGAGGRGAGMELAASSAIECVDRILVDMGRDLGAPAPPALIDIAGDLLGRAAASTVTWAARARLG
ncbi:phytoene desaturase family protein [Sorangium sp. So ce388]|uniref:phytoene desaturase family protein n=1 Tax=Sorangium sp. So ce388 TaxID=3133309 RepID=UPI003F5B0964